MALIEFSHKIWLKFRVGQSMNMGELGKGYREIRYFRYELLPPMTFPLQLTALFIFLAITGTAQI